MKSTRTLALLLTVLAASLLVSGVAHPSDRAPLTRSQFGTILQHLAKESIPIVEYLAQRRFKSPPAIVIGERERALRALSEDYFLQFRASASGVDGATLRAYCDELASRSIQSFLGKYGLSDRTLYLMPENIHQLTRSRGISPAAVPELIRITMIHELAHALHDQWIGVSAQMLNRSRTPSQAKAQNAYLEGFATFIEERAAEFLNFPRDYARVMAVKRTDAGPIGSLNAYDVNQKNESYISGARFFHAVYRKGGAGAVWQELQNPREDPEYMGRIISGISNENSSDAALTAPDITPALKQLEQILVGRGYEGMIADIRGTEINAFLGKEAYSKILKNSPGIRLSVGLGKFVRLEQLGAAPQEVIALLTYANAPRVIEALEKELENVVRSQVNSSVGEDVQISGRELRLSSGPVKVWDYSNAQRTNEGVVARVYSARTKSSFLCLVVTKITESSEPEFVSLLHGALVTADQLGRARSTLPAPGAHQLLAGQDCAAERDFLMMARMGFSDTELLAQLNKLPAPLAKDTLAELQKSGASTAVLTAARAAAGSGTAIATIPAAVPTNGPRILAPPVPERLHFEITAADLVSIAQPENP